MTITQAQASDHLASTLRIAKYLADAIRDLGEVPSGTLYGHVMQHMTLDGYHYLLRTLVGAGLVRVDASHVIHWVG